MLLHYCLIHLCVSIFYVEEIYFCLITYVAINPVPKSWTLAFPIGKFFSVRIVTVDFLYILVLFGKNQDYHNVY